ncbi:hypothetical protein C5167_006058 [Papaver somniferum]|uniref:Uncharacterized protein n=1 Tax=Papaver somniferum TaxID=3469 RepID=A0A4Y7JGH9_PAPSO|nr:hypothetical protein C5167_006058 [Papaver somniferum]
MPVQNKVVQDKGHMLWKIVGKCFPGKITKMLKKPQNPNCTQMAPADEIRTCKMEVETKKMARQ